MPLENAAVLLEHTGHYHRALEQYLLEEDITVYRIHVQKRPKGKEKQELFDVNEVTVEMEDAAGRSVISREWTFDHGPGTALAEQVAPALAATEAADPNNRRSQSRYNCRIGAVVYRAGTSIPNHCCLTDLSSGGCSLEVSLPFPRGSSVEILVRTHELKLRLRGTVQASHPGYGMGVAFEGKTKEEQSNVKKLTDYVASSSN